MTELPELVGEVVDHAVDGEELEAYAVHRISTKIHAGTEATIRDVGRAETRGVGVRVIRDGRLGYASTSDLDPASLRLTVERARANCAASDVDEAQELPSPQVGDPVGGLMDSALTRTTLSEKIRLVTDLARRTIALDPRVGALDTAEYHDEARTVAIASTRGVRAKYEAEYVELWVDALGEDDHGRSSDYAYQFARDPADCDPEALATLAVERTVRLLGPVSPYQPGVPVIVDPHVVADFLTAIGKGLSGGPVSSGRTPFASRHGSTVAASWVSLSDDGRSPTSAGAGAYDDEGVPRRRTQLIDAGVVVGALHSTVTARAAGSPSGSTGNAKRANHKSVPRAAATCLALAPTVSRADLTLGLEEAVYIQQLAGSGSGINAVTGRVDVGGVAWLLRHGEVAGRVDVVPMATTLLQFLSSIVAVADDSHPIPFSPATASTLLCDSELIQHS